MDPIVRRIFCSSVTKDTKCAGSIIPHGRDLLEYSDSASWRLTVSALQPLDLSPITQSSQQIAAEQPAIVQPYPTVEQVMQVCPDSDINNVRKYLPFILKAMVEAGFTSANQLIGTLATIYVETTPFAPIREFGGASARYAPWFGRGFIQLTWESNYRQAGEDLGIPNLVNEPDKALEPEASAKIFFWYWKGATGNNPSKYAEVANWRQVRRRVNGGYHGWDKFKGAVDRGLQILTQPVDPAAIGAAPLAGNYGTGCIDAGSGLTRNIVGGPGGPVNQADALLAALGLAARDRQNGYELRATLNAAADPEILKLDAQKKLEAQGFGEKLSGEYTAQKVTFYPLGPDGITADLIANKPDPDGPPPQIFLGDTSAGLTAPTVAQQPIPVDASGIPARLLAAARKAKDDKRSSRRGPGGGNVACAWAVNLFVVLPAGLENIGDAKGQDGVTVAVKSMTRALEGGRGIKVTREQAVAGDIWISPREAHVGICLTDKCSRVVSNSSSRAAFVWEQDIDGKNRFYGGGPEHGIYRVVS
jgi:hypothetical protein